MSTIASPRPSLTISSRRTSIDTTTSTTSRQQQPSTTRRNRAALRDYYNLPATSSTPPQSSTNPLPSPDLDLDATATDSVLDAPDFDPNAYVQQLLATSGLEGVLRVEAGLIGDIRTLDGEKKALVYDNYSKLIKATETIRVMRQKMDDEADEERAGDAGNSNNGAAMVMMTRTLGPAVERIADVARGLVEEGRKSGNGSGADEEGRRKLLRQKEVVRWVLGAPERIEGLIESGREGEAKEEWEKVESLLGKWEGVKGVEEVRGQCLKALGGG